MFLTYYTDFVMFIARSVIKSNFLFWGVILHNYSLVARFGLSVLPSTCVGTLSIQDSWCSKLLKLTHLAFFVQNNKQSSWLKRNVLHFSFTCLWLTAPLHPCTTIRPVSIGYYWKSNVCECFFFFKVFCFNSRGTNEPKQRWAGRL